MKRYKIATLLLTSATIFFSFSNAFSAPANNESKQPPTLTETRWELVELMGKSVLPGRKKPFIVFQNETNEPGKPSPLAREVTGDSGCNTFRGQYTVKEGNRIEFKQMATTLMACPVGMDTEKEFLGVLEKADSYLIQQNQLELYRARMAPLAKFKAT